MKVDIAQLKGPHRRFNPLTQEWMLVSAERIKRPWSGKSEREPEEKRVVHDPNCVFCPGNPRSDTVTNPHYKSTFTIDNAFPALEPEMASFSIDHDGLFVAQSERGICRVMCFSPRHDLTLAEMDVEDIREIVDAWTEEYRTLGAHDFVRYVQIFENKGEIMGCGQPHPHCQIWASETLPNDLAKEQRSLKSYYESNGSCMLCDYLALEIDGGDRLVCENEHFFVVVPFWAVWPFETIVLSKRHVACLLDLDEAEKEGLADILKKLMVRYDNLFEVSFPYAFGFHQRPTDCAADGTDSTGRPAYPHWHLHAHAYPPLLRSATIKKFMAGYELLATPLRDITPEMSAERLRMLPKTHYRETSHKEPPR